MTEKDKSAIGDKTKSTHETEMTTEEAIQSSNDMKETFFRANKFAKKNMGDVRKYKIEKKNVYNFQRGICFDCQGYLPAEWRAEPVWENRKDPLFKKACPHCKADLYGDVVKNMEGRGRHQVPDPKTKTRELL